MQSFQMSLIRAENPVKADGAMFSSESAIAGPVVSQLPKMSNWLTVENEYDWLNPVTATSQPPTISVTPSSQNISTVLGSEAPGR